MGASYVAEATNTKRMAGGDEFLSGLIRQEICVLFLVIRMLKDINNSVDRTGVFAG